MKENTGWILAAERLPAPDQPSQLVRLRDGSRCFARYIGSAHNPELWICECTGHQLWDVVVWMPVPAGAE